MKIYASGDIISIVPDTNLVTRSCNVFRNKDNLVIGICASNCNCGEEILIQNSGIIDVNTTGIICLGDKLTTSNIPR